MAALILRDSKNMQAVATIGNRVYKIASKRVRAYRAMMPRVPDDGMSQNRMACEAFLMLGIEAFQWLEHLNRGWVRELATKQSMLEFKKVYDALIELYKIWLVPCSDATKWAELHLNNDSDIANYAAFRRCCARAAAFLDAATMEASQDEDELSPDNANALLGILAAPTPLLASQQPQCHPSVPR